MSRRTHPTPRRSRSTKNWERAKRYSISTSAPPLVHQPDNDRQGDANAEAVQHPPDRIASANAVKRTDHRAEKEKDAASGGTTAISHSADMPSLDHSPQEREGRDSWLTLH